MSSSVQLASFCRLCLSVIKDKVPVFTNGNILENLLHLIEIQINPDDEPGAVVCLDCVVTLEGFQQFKEQCHINDEFVKTISPKLPCSASSAEVPVGEEEEDREDLLEVEELEEEDRLELSEAEEVFQNIPQQSAKSNKNKTTAKSLKKVPDLQRAKLSIAMASTSKQQEKHKESPKNPSIDDLQVLAESYPDDFYFEKGPRSIYYTMVFHGERYNSALFTEHSTYWQCIHRRKYQCPAQVWVKNNDYKTFEQLHKHTHGQLPEKEGQAFTPYEALPQIFQMCKKIVLQKRRESVRKAASFEDKFQQFAAKLLEKEEDESESPLTVDDSDSDEEAEVVSRLRPKRKLKSNDRYVGRENQSTKRFLDPETNPKKQAIQQREPKRLQSGGRSKKRVVELRQCKKREQKIQETDEDELEDDTIVEEDLDLDKIEEECKALKIRKRAPLGPSLDEQLVLADSYPDYFFFEKAPRSVYFTLVYYGERFHSALFTEYYTYWQCRHRRKYKCPAQVRVTNDYKTFERRYEHNHPYLTVKEGQPFTPMEALPELFEGCRKVVLKNRAKLRKKLLEKHKFLQTVNLNSSAEQQVSNTESKEEVVEVVQDDNEEEVNGEYVEELIEAKSPLTVDDSDSDEEAEATTRYANEENRSLEPEAIEINGSKMREVDKREYKMREQEIQEMDEDELADNAIVEEYLDLDKIEEECKTLKIRKRAPLGPSLDEQLVLADSYPDYFFFEKFPRSMYFSLVYYGERYHSAVFTEYYTYWQCRQPRRYKCPAQVRVTNDYKTFERRYEHNHPDVPVKEGEAFTPMEALPKLFEVCRKMVLKYRAKRRKKVLEKHKFLQTAEQQDSNTKSIEEVIVAVKGDDEYDVYGEYVEELIEEVVEDSS
ncbi:uncharacterized protein LOC135712719 isoform X2 [Ochlerotatus camptorhynchus]